MITRKLSPIGTPAGGIISEAILDRMSITNGDFPYATEAPHGSMRLTPSDPDFEFKAGKADDVMRRYRNALRVLAQ